MVDMTKPLLFAKVQGNDHVAYPVNVIGSYLNNDGQLRYVVLGRKWDGAPSFFIYDDEGRPMQDAETVRRARDSSGIYDANLVNGDVRNEVTAQGTVVRVTYEGDKPISAVLSA